MARYYLIINREKKNPSETLAEARNKQYSSAFKHDEVAIWDKSNLMICGTVTRSHRRDSYGKMIWVGYTPSGKINVWILNVNGTLGKKLE